MLEGFGIETDVWLVCKFCLVNIYLFCGEAYKIFLKF